MSSHREQIVVLDDEKVPLSDRVVDSLVEHMRATCVMMAELYPDRADCWTWGRCEIRNFFSADGIEFYYGGDDDDDGTSGEFIVKVVEEPEPDHVHMTFDEAWAAKKTEGYDYNSDALQNVRFGWEMAVASLCLEYPSRANIRRVHELEGLVATISAKREWNDRPTPDDEEIAKAHPFVSLEHDRYRRALEMIEARNSKFALVDLVNWLLSLAEKKTKI